MSIKNLPELSTNEIIIDTNSDEASSNLEEPLDTMIDDVNDPDYELGMKDAKKLASVKNKFDYPQVVSTIGKTTFFAQKQIFDCTM